MENGKLRLHGSHVSTLESLARLAEAYVVEILLPPLRVAPCRLNMTLREGHIQTSIYAGGIASALIRFMTSLSVSFEPSARV
jgi:hypothetical protein